MSAVKGFVEASRSNGWIPLRFVSGDVLLQQHVVVGLDRVSMKTLQDGDEVHGNEQKQHLSWSLVPRIFVPRRAGEASAALR